MNVTQTVPEVARGDKRAASRIVMLLALLIVTCQVTISRAQISSEDLSDPSLTAEERKQATLLWLDKYLADSALMSEEDTGMIREAVARMSPSQLKKWLEETRELSERVESPEWQATKKWLRGFLRVQAIYSDEEIEQLRRDIRNADAEGMLVIMQRIQAKHQSLVRMHQASEQSRKSQVQQRSATVAKQAAAAKSQPSRPSNLPLFGSGFTKGQTRSSGYRPPPPLINSRDVARGTVWTEVMGGGGWGPGF